MSLFGDFGHHQNKYLLEFISPIVGRCETLGHLPTPVNSPQLVSIWCFHVPIAQAFPKIWGGIPPHIRSVLGQRRLVPGTNKNMVASSPSGSPGFTPCSTMISMRFVCHSSYSIIMHHILRNHIY